jgi:hypothetical protein
MKFSMSNIKVLAFKKSLKRSIHTAGTGVLRDWTWLLIAGVIVFALLVSVAVYEYVKVLRHVGSRDMQEIAPQKVEANQQVLEEQVATLRARRELLRKQVDAVPVEEMTAPAPLDSVSPSATTSSEIVEGDVQLVE